VWGFNFTPAHYAVAWLTIGALAFHIGVKTHIARRALVQRAAAPGASTPSSSSLSRRGFLSTVAAGSAALTIATVGETWRPFRAISALAVRDPQVGPQGLPVNKSAVGARVLDLIHDPGWRLVVDGDIERPLSLSLDDLRGMELHEVELPITCVEGWSATGRWRGVPVVDLLERAGVAARAVRVESLQQRSRYRISNLSRHQVADRSAILALDLNGEPLAPDHGFPVRLIAPNRPGVLQTKWLSKVTVR
jgi:DMSO/TMAO reductase YedYZ molybdopterin-dependent catalytic subunit